MKGQMSVGNLITLLVLLIIFASVFGIIKDQIIVAGDHANITTVETTLLDLIPMVFILSIIITILIFTRPIREFVGV